MSAAMKIEGKLKDPIKKEEIEKEEMTETSVDWVTMKAVVMFKGMYRRDSKNRFYPPADELSVSESCSRCESQAEANSIVMDYYSQFKEDKVKVLELSKNKAGYLKVSMENGENDYEESLVEETYEAGVYASNFEWESMSDLEEESEDDEEGEDEGNELVKNEVKSEEDNLCAPGEKVQSDTSMEAAIDEEVAPAQKRMKAE